MKNLSFVFACLLLAVPCQARIIFVDANTPDNNDGSSWAKAYKYLQDALADANSTGDVNEIRVAQGIYTPDSNSAFPNGSGDRQATFQLANGVAIKGGFAGLGQPDPNARDIELYETILSGDLLDNDDPCTPIEDMLNDPCRADNCYHLFYHPTGTALNATAILDGFIITAGNANGSALHLKGGGMYNVSGNPTLTNCTFNSNSAYFGGGMANMDNSSPTVTSCTFSTNSGNHSGGGMHNYRSSPTVTNCTFSRNSAGYGGGMYNRSNSSPTITNCTFSGNSAEYGGGMENIAYSSPTVTNCTFTANSADDGGGIFNYESSPTVTNCTFSDNSAGSCGGGMVNFESNTVVSCCLFVSNSAGPAGGGVCNLGCSPTFTNCRFVGNLAPVLWITGGGGGGVYNSGGSPALTNCIFSGNWAGGGDAMSNDASQPTLTHCTFTGNGDTPIVNWWEDTNLTLTNCILWDHTDNEIWNIHDSSVTVTYTNVKSGWPGLGNIDMDPCFVDPGYWDTNGTPEDSNDDFWVDGDYHLKSEGWRWHEQRKVWTWDDVTSRCIDAGNPGSPLGDELLSVPDDPNNIWGQNLRINMGAFGGTAEASMPPYDWAILGDLTNDGLINLTDFASQAADWLNSADQQPGDLNRDSLVYISDLSLLVEDWLKQTTWHE